MRENDNLTREREEPPELDQLRAELNNIQIFEQGNERILISRTSPGERISFEEDDLIDLESHV